MTLLFADLHLEEKSAPTALEVLKRIPLECKNRNETHVVFLGDFFQIRHTIPVRLLLAARDIMAAWFDLGIRRFDVVVGNHDQVSTDGRNALEVFDGLGSATHVHTEPTWTTNGLFLPWRFDHAEIQKALALPRGPHDDNVLFAHLAIKNAWMNNTKADVDGIDSEVVMAAGFRRVFAGHYHRHQTVRKGMLYVGSPYQVSYAEAGQPKGFVTWDGKEAKHVAWDVGRRHHKIVVDADNPQPFALPDVRPGDKLWVVCKGQMANAMRDTIAKAVEQTGIEAERIDVDLQPTSTTARLEAKPGDTVLDLGLRYCEAQEVDPSFKTMLAECWRQVVGA